MKIDPFKQRLTQEILDAPVESFLSTPSLVFQINQTVEDVLTQLHAQPKQKKDPYFYVTDEKGTLQGFISTHDLIYTKPTIPLADIFDPDVIKVKKNDSIEKTFKLLNQHQLLALPVVDSEDIFLGVIEVGLVEEEGSTKKKNLRSIKEDLFQFIGFSIEQRQMSSTLSEFRLRMPWLLCNLVGGLICAVIGEFFKETLIRYVMLALFIPLVLSLSESISVQAMTISLRFLHLKKIQASQVQRRIHVEWKASLLLGLASSLLIAAFYFAWSVELYPLLALCLSITVSMMISAIFGALFPIILHLLKLDPKVAAGPVVLTMADIFTVIIYFGLATALLM